MLKSNFLNYKTLRNIDDVERKIDFFFIEHNDVIPRQVFRGATPREMFLGTWTELQAIELKAGLKVAAAKRKADYRAMYCGVCKSI